MRLSSKLLLAAAILFAAAAGDSVAAGKTLDETLTFIRDSIAREGKVTYTVAMHDSADNSNWSQTMTSEATNVRYDNAACSLSFHWVTSADGQIKQDIEGVMNFGRGKSVAVVNREQEIRTQVIAAGNPTWTAIVTPQVWVVTVVHAGTTNVVNFTDQDKAEKVVRAIDHAMDLCDAPKEGF